MTPYFGKPYRRKDGQIGARVRVRLESGGYITEPSFDTHGMSSAAVADHLRALEAKFRAKAGRLTGFRAVHGTEFVRGGEVYRIVDCTIRGDRDELYLDVRRVEQDGSLTTVEGFPLRRRYRTIADIPSDQGVIALVRGALPQGDDIGALHGEFVRKVTEKLKGGE